MNGFRALLTDPNVLLVEATLANPAAARALRTVRYDFGQIALVVGVPLLFDALDAETFDAGPLHHDQAMAVLGVLQHIVAEVSRFGALLRCLLGDGTPICLHGRFEFWLYWVHKD